ncbi:DUF368 domain-containing protein [Piscibacillus sp. B03]|uniref:DUF368 domain-containing protein n=1 Tax=Piscibacillus sp. B03 TaxID=3457430 RepID=UPI003FCDA607
MFKNFLRGAVVGMTETVPGVSGSTVALVLGVYEHLIYCLSIITSPKRKEAYPFLLTFGLGMFMGFILSLHLISYLLSVYRTPTLMFFVGIIIGFLPFLWKQTMTYCERKLNLIHYFIVLSFFAIVISGSFLAGINSIDVTSLSIDNYIFLFISGVLASTALVLPGISGALILTILGVYEIATESLINLFLPITLSIGCGILLGVVITSKLVKYLLNKYPLEIYLAMFGLVSGSIIAIFNNLERILTNKMLIESLITLFLGIIVVNLLNYIQKHYMKKM